MAVFDDKDFDHLTNMSPGRQRAQSNDGSLNSHLVATNGLSRSAFKPGEVRRLLEHTPGFIAVLRGPELTFEMVNAAYAELVGPRHFLGRPAMRASRIHFCDCSRSTSRHFQCG